MRAILWALLCGCSSAAPRVATPPAPPETTSFLIDPVSGQTRPLAGSGASEEGMVITPESWRSEMQDPPTYLRATIAGVHVEIAAPALRCGATAMGCPPGQHGFDAVLQPRSVVLRERAPPGSRIAYFERLPGGWVLGLDRSIRTYVEDEEGRPVRHLGWSSPGLAPLTIVADTLVLSTREPGPLWLVRWSDSGDEPRLERSNARFDSPVVLAADLWIAPGVQLLALTEHELVGLDRTTLTRLWQLRGDVRGFVVVDHRTFPGSPDARICALVVERPSPSRAVVRVVVLDGSGRPIHDHAVHDGDHVDARFGRVDATTFVVHLERR
jgi:hypothetical protein